VVFAGFENDSPSRGEHGVVDCQVVGLEGKTSEDGRDSDGLTIGEMDHRWCHTGVNIAIEGYPGLTSRSPWLYLGGGKR